jgi:hypothetical protein
MTDDIIERVETFIRRLHDMDICINKDAQTIPCNSVVAGKPETNLAVNIGDAINQYEGSKAKSLEERKKIAMVCLVWINKAYALNVINESNTTLRKISEKDAQISVLEQKFSALQADYDDLQQTHQKTADDNIAWQSKLEQLREDYDKLLNVLTQEGGITQS